MTDIIHTKKQSVFGQILLITATVLWGTSFAILDDTLRYLPVLFVLGVRFLTCALILFAVFHKRFRGLKARSAGKGLLLGAVLTTAYLFQTYGLTGVTPGENAFLTSTYSVMVPFMCWAFFREKPSVWNFVAGVVCIAGVGFLNLDGAGFTFGLGHALTLVCAVFYGLQILVIGHVCKDEDPMVMLFFQLFVVGVVCSLGTLTLEVGRLPFTFTPKVVAYLVYLTFLCTLAPQACQMVGQRYVESSKVGILLSLESVFGFAFSLLLGGETFDLFAGIGFLLIFLSVLISETKLAFLKKKKSPEEKGNTKGENV